MNEAQKIAASDAAEKAASYVAALEVELAGYKASGKGERAKSVAEEIARVKKAGRVTPLASTPERAVAAPAES